jgi:hypothetical protein
MCCQYDLEGAGPAGAAANQTKQESLIPEGGTGIIGDLCLLETG